jgi:hypothetical protein
VTEPEFLALLNGVEFPRRYWELCDRFPVRPTDSTYQGRKEDILAAFRDVGVVPRCEDRGRLFIIEEEKIGDLTWCGVFCKHWNGLELMIEGQSDTTGLGSNFAALAYDTRRLADPSFHQDRFRGPPPSPRPAHGGDPAALREIVKEFVNLVRLVKDGLRRRVG